MSLRTEIAIRCLAPLAIAALLATGGVAAAAAPAAPVEVAFDALIEHVGEHVRVTTKFGTVREGELTGASPIAINVKLDDRGLVLGMPKETIAKVEVVAAAATAPGSTK